MKTIAMKKILAFFWISFFFGITCLYAERVRYVNDGDTFILANNQRVRMIGIDAPEIDHPKYGKKGEPFGKESWDYLRSLIQGREVTLEVGDEPFDRFGRRLAYVYLEDGTFVNRLMIQEGYAETFRKFPFKYKREFLELQRQAQAAGLGMWGERPKTWWEKLKDRMRKK